MFGEGDPLFVPSLVANARAGKTKYYIGSGKNMTDFTYVGNIAAAHVQVWVVWVGKWVGGWVDT